jgi:membrane-associated phospholipid phosphatase
METTETVDGAMPTRPVHHRALGAARTAGMAVMVLLKNPRLYVGLGLLLLGIQLNFHAQVYLHENFGSEGDLPVLSDLILDNLPYIDIGYAYDALTMAALLLFAAYVAHKKQYHRVPYILALCGAFQTVRAIFIVLTPLGHPALFDGTEGPFNGFSKFEMGVFPSGHTGISFLYVLLARDRVYKLGLLTCVLIIVVSLFLARGHYSVDVLSGMFFAYAIKAFGDKHFRDRLTVKGLRQRLDRENLLEARQQP